mmetsp:Transcript_86119/g.227160  ORF Transcript_86119/g.227160 Transcript_86119/m.227160 type:complete len:80 (+) Transcript_86119:174-413(+)
MGDSPDTRKRPPSPRDLKEEDWVLKATGEPSAWPSIDQAEMRAGAPSWVFVVAVAATQAEAAVVTLAKYVRGLQTQPAV